VVCWDVSGRQEVSCDSMGHHAVWFPRIVLNEYMKHFRGALSSLCAEQVHIYVYFTQLFIMFCTKDWNCLPASFSWSKRSYVEIMIQESSLL